MKYLLSRKHEIKIAGKSHSTAELRKPLIIVYIEAKMFQPTDIVIAKMKGYPPWPAMIIPFEIIPQQVLSKNRSKLPEDFDSDSDDTEKIEYSSMLSFKKFKRELSNYCVKFFHDDSYVWLNPRNLTTLDMSQIDTFLSKVNVKTSKKLSMAYEMAKQGLSSGIDVWEFVEYGSEGKPDDDDYTDGENEDYEEEYTEENSEPSTKRKLTRSSKRTAAKKSKTLSRRATRSNSNLSADTKEVHSEEILATEDKTKQKNKQSRKSKQSATMKGKSNPLKKQERVEPTIYHYEDDVDWRIMGLGPQDLTLNSNHSLFSKLNTKKNVEIHNDLKLELRDRLSAINSMLTEYILGQSEDPDLIHLILDEMTTSLSLKGNNDELWTVFFANNEVLLNLRALLNLKRADLVDLGVLDQLLSFYREIYDADFQFDKKQWSESASILKVEELSSGKTSEVADTK